MYTYDIVLLGQKNVKCRYHLTGDYYMWTANGIEYRRKCTGIMCPKHSSIARARYATKINNVLPHYKHRFFVTLPIGRLISQDEFKKLWSSFTDAIRYKYPGIEYIFVKEVQNDFLHVHGIIVSNSHDDVGKVGDIWFKYLKKCVGIVHVPTGEEVGAVISNVASAKYVTKDVKNPLGVQMPPRGWTKRLVLPSGGFWKPLRPAEAGQASG